MLCTQYGAFLLNHLFSNISNTSLLALLSNCKITHGSFISYILGHSSKKAYLRPDVVKYKFAMQIIILKAAMQTSNVTTGASIIPLSSQSLWINLTDLCD